MIVPGEIVGAEAILDEYGDRTGMIEVAVLVKLRSVEVGSRTWINVATGNEAGDQPSKLIHLLRELLALVHGDGGHYVEEHGLEKASKDAEEKIVKLMQQAGI